MFSARFGALIPPLSFVVPPVRDEAEKQRSGGSGGTVERWNGGTVEHMDVLRVESAGSHVLN